MNLFVTVTNNEKHEREVNTRISLNYFVSTYGHMVVKNTK